MKKIIYILLGLIIVVVIAIIVALDPISKKISQEYATDLLKTPVKISQSYISLLDKSLNIDFIEVQNPPSFNNKNALSLDHFFLKVSDETAGDLIVIDELKLEGLTFALEQNGISVNLTQLIDNLGQQSSVSSSGTDGDDHDDKRIKINQFKVDNIALKIDTDWLKTTLTVPNISASNFGGGSGVKVSEIGQKIAQEIFDNLKKALEKEGIEAGKQKIKETLMRKIGDKLGIENIKEKLNIDSIKNAVDTDKLKDKAKELFKALPKK